MAPIRYRSPAPGGQIGRTDEGVDWTTAPGSPVVAIGPGIIDFVGYYAKGFGNYIAMRLTGGPARGEEIYYAEFDSPTVKAGQRVRGGQQVARAAGGLEVGFAQKGGSYLPVAQVQGGYTEGQATPAGKRFRNLIDTGNAQNTLGQLWIQAGGAPRLANLMAAIALAESGGSVGATHQNDDGSVDYGIWQINSSHTQYDPTRLTTDPLYNARAAVAVEHSQGLRAWSTYTNGAYKDHLPGASKTPVGGIVRPGGEDPNAGDTGENQLAAWRDYLNPTKSQFWDPLDVYGKSVGAIHDVTSFMKWIAWIFHPQNILRAVEFLIGSTILMIGVSFAYRDAQRGGGRQFPSHKKGGSLAAGVTAAAALTPQGRALRTAGKASKLAQAGEGAAKARRAEETHQVKTKTEKAKATELRTRGNRKPPRVKKKKQAIGFS